MTLHPLLQASNLCRTYRSGEHSVVALAPVSLCINAGEFLTIGGPSGSGKSTLLHLLSGLDRPSSGKVLFQQQSLTDLSIEGLAALRNRDFGFVFQTPHLLTDKTVIENVLLPFTYSDQGFSPSATARCRALLTHVGLVDMEDRYPSTLSGGEMQRVVFARALALEPKIIFADEPTGSLDAANAKQVLALLTEQADLGRAVVMVSHDAEALELGTTKLLLKKAVIE
ncbi:MAG: ABC transporter ATP-binding protein [Mariprofundaceae bacterium]